MNKQIVASNLKKVRTALGWSQEKAAQQMGIRRSTLASYEEGRALPAIILFPKIVHVYGISDWKGFIQNPDFEFTNQKSVPETVSLIEEKYNSLTAKEKILAKTLLNLP